MRYTLSFVLEEISKFKQALALDLNPFKAFFGVSAQICDGLWRRFLSRVDTNFWPRHMRWTLRFQQPFMEEFLATAEVCT